MLQNQTDFLNALNKITEGNTSDDVLEVLEYASKMDADGTNRIAELEAQITTLQNEKTDLENTWREKYKNAFFNPPAGEYTNNQQKGQDKEENNSTTIQIKDLFKPKQ